MIPIAPGLQDRYSLPSPRYTSYPTLMHWGDAPDEPKWLASLDAALLSADAHCGIYVHVPFCQSLCTFCGCNMRLARNHALAAPYVETVLKEFDLYRARLAKPRLVLGEMHLGGGSPTYLPAGVLDRLLDGVLQHYIVGAQADLAIEVDPRNTTREQLQVLRRHEFKRLSIGVQDLDPRVLEIVNRTQSETEVRTLVDTARELGFASISFDLIYGLPLQTTDSLRTTFDVVTHLQPERISFLPYAHVPWIKPSQRRYTEADLPEAAPRQQLFAVGRECMAQAGFIEIGMDQYAQPRDGLVKALHAGTLHRNFMGFTANPTHALLGLGVSAIGAGSDAYAQNEKSLQQYEARVKAQQLPLQRGHVLSQADLGVRKLLWALFTRSRALPTAADRAAPWWPAAHAALCRLELDGLTTVSGESVTVTELGRAFLRQVGVALDQHLRQN